MLDKIKNTMARKQVEVLLKEYGLELKHFLPGRVRVAIVNWQGREKLILNLLEEIKNDPDVISMDFTKETSTVLIYYNKKAIHNPMTVNRWKAQIKKYM